MGVTGDERDELEGRIASLTERLVRETENSAIWQKKYSELVASLEKARQALDGIRY